jgi:hypothetical protein
MERSIRSGPGGDDEGSPALHAMVAMALTVEKRHEAEDSSSDTWDAKWR